MQFTLWDFVECYIYWIALYVAANFIYILIKSKDKTMTEASRCGGKIKFIMPDNWSQEQTEKLADNVLEQVAPKITKLAKPKKKKRDTIKR